MINDLVVQIEDEDFELQLGREINKFQERDEITLLLKELFVELDVDGRYIFVGDDILFNDFKDSVFQLYFTLIFGVHFVNKFERKK